MSEDKNMLGEETLNEQEAAKEVNGEAAAASVKASIDASAKKKQAARKGDKLGTEDAPGVLPGAGDGGDTPGQTAKLESMSEEELDAYLESLSEEELDGLLEEIELEEKRKCDEESETVADFKARGGKVKKLPPQPNPYRKGSGLDSGMSARGKETRDMTPRESVDFSDDVAALCESEATLSENFKEKAALVLEAAYEARVATEVERLEEQYQEVIAEEIASINEQLVDQVDSYLNYVVEGWMQENELAIETGLRADIAESFMKGLQSVFTEHYVEVPESKVDLVDELAERIQELEENLNSVMEDNIELNEAYVSSVRANVLVEASANLSQSQAAKLESLSESVVFESVEDFVSKVETLRESYFGAEKVIAEEVEVSEGEEQLDENMSERMSQYLSALRRSQ